MGERNLIPPQRQALFVSGKPRVAFKVYYFRRKIFNLPTDMNVPMTIPKDKQIYEGELATYWFDNGILVSLSKNPKRTVANITENVALVKKISDNKKVPLLIYLSNSSVPDKGTRKFASEQLPIIYSAMAMVSKPGLAKFIMNILFMLNPPPIPMKSFANDKEANEWLKQYI